MSLFHSYTILGHIGTESREGDIQTGGYRKRRYNHNLLGNYSIYRNKKAWMTKNVFLDVIRDFSERMHEKYPGEKIALLMDNCSSHLVDFSQFLNLEIIFLPPNTTAYLQPLDQGYFHQVKANIIRWQREFIVLNEQKPTIKQKIEEFIDVACRIKPEVITKYWRMAGLLTEDDPESIFTNELDVLQRIENVEQVPIEKPEYESLILHDNRPMLRNDHANETIEYFDADPADPEETFELVEILPPTTDYSFELTDTALNVLAEGFYCDEPSQDTQGSLSDEQLRQFVHSDN